MLITKKPRAIEVCRTHVKEARSKDKCCGLRMYFTTVAVVLLPGTEYKLLFVNPAKIFLPFDIICQTIKLHTFESLTNLLFKRKLDQRQARREILVELISHGEKMSKQPQCKFVNKNIRIEEIRHCE